MAQERNDYQSDETWATRPSNSEAGVPAGATREQAAEDLLERWQELREQGVTVSVRDLCAGEPDLLETVQRRVSALRAMEAFLDVGDDTDKTPATPRLTVRPVVTAAESADQDPDATRDSREPGQKVAEADSFPQVPGYEILDELGRGGMGVVYKARQKGLNRIVALKMILAGSHAGAQQRARFQAEAEAVARLQHANIVQVHEVGEHDGLPFFSLEFCPGGSLSHKLRGDLLPVEEAARLVQTLARALDVAHRANVVHRDLKPANILLGADGTPKVADFGLAKRLDEDSQTQAGAVMGTPSYMAPEQAAGDAQAIGPWTDVYALGSILYELLTGRPPFKGPNVWETVEQVRSQEPVPPRQLQPKIPRDLETVCLKCLRKDPHQRYESAAALADDLGRFLAGEPVVARPVPAWQRAAKWARRRPAQALLAASVVVTAAAVVVGAVLYGMYQDRVASGLREQAAHQQSFDKSSAGARVAAAGGRWTEAAEGFDRALAVLDADPSIADAAARKELEDGRAKVRRRLEEEAAQRDRRERAKKAADLADRIKGLELNPNPEDRAAGRQEIRRLAAEALRAVDVRPEAPPAESARSLAAFAAPLGPPAEARRLAAGCFEVLLVWADAEAEGPDGDGARKALRLLDVAEALAGANGLPLPRALHLRRAGYLSALGDKAGAGAASARAEKARPATGLDFFLAGWGAWREGQLKDAEAACEQALLRQPDHYWARYLLALCQLKAGRWDEARAGLTDCLGRRPSDPFWPRLFRASACAELGRFGDAAADFRQCLDEAKKDPFRRYVALTNRGAFRVRQRHWDEALKDLRGAVALQPGSYQAYVNLAELHRLRKEPAEAVKALSRALEHKTDAGLYYTRALRYKEQGKAALAVADFRKVLGLDPAGSGARWRPSACVELAELYHASGEFDKALAMCDEALEGRREFAPAHRQRARSLLKLGRYAEAGQALDRYLKAGGKGTAKVHAARGLIRAKLKEYPAAVEAYTQALALEKDAATLCQRGWIYLKLQATAAALDDFEAALRLEKGRGDALCGRAHARLALGRLDEAVADADEALRHGPLSARELVSLACVHARAVGLVLARRQPLFVSRPAVEVHERRAQELLCQALEQVPAERRAEFWRQSVAPESALAVLRSSDGMRRLVEAYGR